MAVEIENELKYVLDIGICKLLEDLRVPCSKLKQAYVDGIRVRKEVSPGGFSSKCTVNKKIQTKKGQVLELEFGIDSVQFDKILAESDVVLDKVRYSIDSDIAADKWVIDIFRKKDDKDFNPAEAYFAMAECEMQESNKEFPSYIPEYIKKYLIYEVPREDSSLFSSMLLADKQHALKMLDDIEYVKNELT